MFTLKKVIIISTLALFIMRPLTAFGEGGIKGFFENLLNIKNEQQKKLDEERQKVINDLMKHPAFLKNPKLLKDILTPLPSMPQEAEGTHQLQVTHVHCPVDILWQDANNIFYLDQKNGDIHGYFPGLRGEFYCIYK